MKSYNASEFSVIAEITYGKQIALFAPLMFALQAAQYKTNRRLIPNEIKILTFTFKK